MTTKSKTAAKPAKKKTSTTTKTAEPKEPKESKPTRNVANIAAKKALDKIDAALRQMDVVSYDGKVPGWVSSGDWVSDLMLSLGKGYPLGRIVHLYGKKSSGKTGRALAAVAEVMAMGGIAHYFNQESGWDDGWATTMNVNTSSPNFRLYPPQHLEKCGDAIVKIVKNMRGVDVPTVIVLDSLGGSCTEARDEKTVVDGRVVSETARLARDFCNKLVPHLEMTKCLIIVCNHTWMDFSQYTRPGVPKPEKPSGGDAVPFYSAIELKITRGPAEKTQDGKIRYRRMITEIIKNKVAPTAEYKWTSPLYQRTPSNRVSGFDEGMCCLDFMVEIKAWKKVKTQYKIYLMDGEVISMSRKEFRNRCLDDSDFAAQVRDVTEMEFKKFFGL